MNASLRGIVLSIAPQVAFVACLTLAGCSSPLLRRDEPRMGARAPSPSRIATFNAIADGAEAAATSAEAAATAAEQPAIKSNDDTRKKLAIESRKAAIESRNIASDAKRDARLLASGHLRTSSTVSDPPQHTILASDRVALPTQKRSEFLAIEARINGAGPFRLIVDTGTAGLALSAETAKRANLEPRPEPNTETSVLNGVIETQVAQIDRLESGGLLLKGFSAGVGTTEDFGIIRQEIGADVDGFLGIAPLADVLLEMDFPESQVNVLRRGKQVYPAGSACNYTLGEGDAPMVMVAVGDNSFPVLFDTGSDSALALPRLDSIPLRFPWLKQDSFRGGMGTRVVRNESSQLSGDARIGPVTLHDPPVENGFANIGVNVLGHWKIVLDQHDQLIYFLGPELSASWAPIKPPELQLKLGVLGRIEKTGLRVVDTDVGSAGALAGLSPDDLITLINGESAAAFVERVAKYGITLTKDLQVLRTGHAAEVHLVIGIEDASK